MKHFRVWALAIAMPMALTVAFAQGGLDRGRPKQGGGGSGPSNPPSKGGGNGPSRGPANGPSNGPSRDRDRTPPNAPNAPKAPNAPSRDRDRLPGGFGSGSDLPNIPNRPTRSRYGTINNGRSDSGRITISQIPDLRGNTNGMLDRVNRNDPFAVQNNWRWGYYHYNRNWQDDLFCFPNYTFAPIGGFNSFVFSPWYGYTFLPPYLNNNAIIVVSNWNPGWNWGMGTAFVWNTFDPWRNNWNNRDDRWDDRREGRQQDEAIAFLVDAFEQGDRRSVARVVPRGGRVAILRDGRYEYSVQADDFYDLLLDNVLNAKTRSYEVVDAQYRGRSVRIVMRHRFVDPWGAEQTVFHSALLEPERGAYVIREFGTSLRGVW